MSGRAPACPYSLGDAGSRWWRWAWKLPQAAKWDAGARYAVARRAQLEDDFAAVADLADFDASVLEGLFTDIDGSPERLFDVLRDLAAVIGRLQALAASKLALMKEMRELEMQLGLGPKAMAGLGWRSDDKPQKSKLDELRARRDARAGRSAS